MIRNGDLASALTVNLSTSDTNEVTLTAAVFIPAGQSSAVFAARAIRDFRVNGPKIVAVGASAIGFSPGSLVAGMVRGRQTVVEFKLANEGGTSTGPITIALPTSPWLSLATTNPVPPLTPDETNATTITLLLTPVADLTLGAYEGSLALNSSNASLTVPFNFRALSEAKGDLLITAVDELTYYAVGSPNLAGASVTVRDAVTRTNVTTGVTGNNGQFFVSSCPRATTSWNSPPTSTRVTSIASVARGPDERDHHFPLAPSRDLHLDRRAD